MLLRFGMLSQNFPQAIRLFKEIELRQAFACLALCCGSWDHSACAGRAAALNRGAQSALKEIST